MVRFAQNKSRVNKFIGLLHIWHWLLTLLVTLAMNLQGQILKLPYFFKYMTSSWILKEGYFIGWCNILWTVSDLRFAFIICYTAVQMWRFCRRQYKYAYITNATVIVCIYGIMHAWALCWVSLHILHRSYMKFAQLYVSRTSKLFRYDLLHLFKNDWNADRLMNTRRSPRSYHMTASKNGTWWTSTVLYQDSTMNNTENKHKTFERMIYPSPRMYWLVASHARLCNWNLIHSVGQTGDMHWRMDGIFTKGLLFPKLGAMHRLIDDRTLLQMKIIVEDLDSLCESSQWSLKFRTVQDSCFGSKISSVTKWI